jgi:hypothetical protein
MNKRWPLHPKPEDNQLLCEWVKDLADLYEVSYQHFCQKVLKLTSEEIFDFRSSVPEKALIILSNGTGIPIYDLRGRDIDSRHKKWKEEYESMVKAENLQRSTV